MEQAMQVRDATPEDLPAIHTIYQHYVDTSISTLREDALDLAESQPYFNRLKTLNMPYLVAIEPNNSEIVGFAYADLFNDRSGYKHTVEDTIYIHPSHCGKGIGKLLLQGVLESLRTVGKRVVIAKMSILPHQPAHENASCRLHMSLGFREVGRLENVGYKLETLVDVIIFQRDLDRFDDDDDVYWQDECDDYDTSCDFDNRDE